MGQRVVSLRLEKGCNTIRLSNATNWMPDIDYMELTPVHPSAIGHQHADCHQPHPTVYNLQGQKVDAATAQGIIISDGRKIAATGNTPLQP